jgi:hypothetical protein
MFCVQIVEGVRGWLFATATQALAWHGDTGAQSTSFEHGSSLLTGPGRRHAGPPPRAPSGLPSGGAASVAGADSGAVAVAGSVAGSVAGGASRVSFWSLIGSAG